MLSECVLQKDSDTFGHRYPEQPFENCSIVTFQNIGRLPKSAYGYKSVQMSRAFQKSKASTAMYAELSINDRFMNPNEKFIDRMRLKNPKSYSIISYNINMGEAATWNTVGGTAITLDCNFNSHRTKQSNGRDPTGLGRWTRVRLRGRGNIHTSYISAYRPCKNVSSMRGVLAQHINYFRTKKNMINPDPIKIFDDDLCREIEKWTEQGDNIVLGIYMNDDVKSSQLARRLKSVFNLKDGILSTHSSLSSPATFNRNKSRTAIDAIFVSQHLEIV